MLILAGLDEYSSDGVRPLKSWLPGEADLPDGTALLVSSRAGVQIDLRDHHPLRGNVDTLARSDAATEIRSLAIEELEDALKPTDELQYEIAVCLAACCGGQCAALLIVVPLRGPILIPRRRAFAQWRGIL